MKFKVFASLITIALLIPNSPVLAIPPLPQLWNKTTQTVTFTVCGYSPRYRTNVCDDVVYEPGGYGELSCEVGTCTVSVILNRSRKSVRYSDGMAVSLTQKGVLKAFYYK
jgi:hypothetical protein